MLWSIQLSLRENRLIDIQHGWENCENAHGRIHTWYLFFTDFLLCFLFFLPYPIGSMYGIFTYIYHKNQPTVGEYIIHGSFGYLLTNLYFRESSIISPQRPLPPSVSKCPPATGKFYLDVSVSVSPLPGFAYCLPSPMWESISKTNKKPLVASDLFVAIFV